MMYSNFDLGIDFQIKATLDFFVDGYRKEGKFLFYPKIKEDFEGYFSLLQKASTTYRIPEGEIFEIPIKTGIGSDYYKLVWDIDAILQYTTKNNFQVETISLNDEKIWCSPEHINPSKLIAAAKLGKTDPLILVEHAAIDKFIVIDGCHRFQLAKMRGQTKIKAIRLSPKVHAKFLLTDLHRKVFCIHHNLKMLSHLGTQARNHKFTTDDNFHPLAYYPLNSRVVIFKSFKNYLIKSWLYIRWIMGKPSISFKG